MLCRNVCVLHRFRFRVHPFGGICWRLLAVRVSLSASRSRRRRDKPSFLFQAHIAARRRHDDNGLFNRIKNQMHSDKAHRSQLPLGVRQPVCLCRRHTHRGSPTAIASIHPSNVFTSEHNFSFATILSRNDFDLLLQFLLVVGSRYCMTARTNANVPGA